MAIYYLDADDEVTSAAARIRDSSDDRIALVLSGGSRVATSRINFRLLAREARHRHKRLAIIAADPSVQSVVRSAELPVYASVGEYEKAEAARARGLADGTTTDVSDALDELALTVGSGTRAAAGGFRSSGGFGDSGGPAYAGSGRPSRVAGGPVGSRSFASGFGGRVSKPAIAAIGVIVVLVLAASAFFFYPSATVVLTLREEPVGPIALRVTVDPGVAAPNDQAGMVPGLNKAFPVSASGTFDATGQKVDETPAAGTVTFTSKNTFLAVPVLAGTQVSTPDGIAFVTTKNVTVPTANFDTQTAGKADAPVTAVQKGVAGNVAAARIVKIPSDLAAAKLSVSNKSATTGGTHTVTPQVAQSDIDKAEASLFSQLDTQFQAALVGPDAAPTGSALLAASAHLGLATCSPDPAGLVNQEGPSFDLTCTSSGSATLADMAVVKALGERRVKGSVKEGYELVDSSITADLGTPIAQGTAIVVPVTVRAAQVKVVDPDVIRAGVKGKSLEEARAFASLYGTAEISVSPDWASTMPSFDFRIDVQLVAPNGGAGSSASPGTTPRTAHPVTPTSPPVTVPTTTGSPPPGSVSPSTPPTASPSPSPAAPPSPSATPGASPSPADSAPPAPTPSPS